MANVICYGTNLLAPTIDGTIDLIYDADTNLETNNEVRLLVNTAGLVPAALTINLPSIANFTGIFGILIIVCDSGNNAAVKNININAFAGETVNGGASVSLTANGTSTVIGISDKTHWYAY